MPTIEWNGKHYIVEGGITQGYVRRQTDPFRTTGVTLRSNDASIPPIVYRGWEHMGIGWARADRETGRGVNGLRFATADTRFRIATNQLLAESQTHATPADFPKKYVNFKGDLFGLFEEVYDAGDALHSLECYKFDAANDEWDAVGTIFDSDDIVGTARGVRGWDMIVHEGALIALSNQENSENIGGIFRSTDGATWADISGTGWSITHIYSDTVARRHNFDDDGGKLLSFGSRLFVALNRSDLGGSSVNGTIEIFYTDDDGTNWTTGPTFPSASGPKAFVQFQDTDGVTMPCVVSAEGVWAINAAAGTASLLPAGKMSGDSNDGRNAVRATDGSLYLPTGAGDIRRVIYLGNGNYEDIPIGPHSVAKFEPSDGLPAAYQGHANYLLDTDSPFLFAAYGGHAASTNGWVAAYHKQRGTWHVQYDEPDANVDITLLGYSTETDATPRLFFALENASSAEMFHQEEPLVSAVTGVSQKYEQLSIMQFAEEDFGNPEVDAGIFLGSVAADGLEAAATDDAKITWKYGTDGEDWDANTVTGDFHSDDLDLEPATGGVSAKVMRNELTLDRGSTNTDTVELREFQLLALNRLLKPRYWDFVIDVRETANLYAGNHPPGDGQAISEKVLENIESNAEMATSLTFKVGGKDQTRVVVHNDQPPRFTLEAVDSQNEGTGYLVGSASIHVEEVS